MIAFITVLENEGPSDSLHPLPKKPTSTIPSGDLLGRELHQYLKENIYTENYDDVPEIPKEKKFETLMSSLKESKEYDLNKSCLEFQYNYGKILEEFFKLWKGNNYKGISWQKG